MSFNTCLFAWKALLTPTIEKIIFLSSAIFFILLIYVSCHISLFFLHLSVIPRMCEELIHQQQNDTDTDTYPINGIGDDPQSTYSQTGNQSVLLPPTSADRYCFPFPARNASAG